MWCSNITIVDANFQNFGKGDFTTLPWDIELEFIHNPQPQPHSTRDLLLFDLPQFRFGFPFAAHGATMVAHVTPMM